MVYKQVVRRALFGMHGGDAERVHETTLNVMARLGPLARFGVANMWAEGRKG